MACRSLTALAILCIFLLSTAYGHEVRPAYLQIVERQHHRYDILWKQPSIGPMAVHLEPRISGLALETTPSVTQAGSGFQVREWRDVDAGPQGLNGRELRIDGLEHTITDVLVRIERSDVKLDLDARSVTMSSYLPLGIERIEAESSQHILLPLQPAVQLEFGIEHGGGGSSQHVLRPEQPAVQLELGIEHGWGGSSQYILRPEQPAMRLDFDTRNFAVSSYLRLGIEHILTGVDHLALILGLMLLVRSRTALVKSITAFTVAHSITLAATALHLIAPHPAVIETLVALSILFLSIEVLEHYRGRDGFTARCPWLIAFAFGLLHGSALAGALAEVGLPRDAIPSALLLFNLGVEIGQLLFITVAIAIGTVLLRHFRRLATGTRWVVPYVMGSCAAFWVLSGIETADAADRDVYFGDLHLHTSYSFDAYLNAATVVTPDEAYRFAKGESITYLGEPLRRREPLDFLAVTDHAENIGVFEQLDHPPNAVSASPIGRMFQSVRTALTQRAKVDPEAWDAVYQYFLGTRNELPPELKAESTAAWKRVIDAANRHYQPGRFTTFIAYEWTAMPNGANLHRNVIFRGDHAPYPFTSFDSRYPEDLWSWLETLRQQGIEALAIPHNANASNGLMYDWVSSSGLPITRVYAERRQINEPLSEIAQDKGASETHPALSPNDEFADYEIYDYLAGLRSRTSQLPGSYLRDGLGRGLLIQQRTGANPYKYGFVGASDQHSGLSISAQADFAGNHYAINAGAGKPTREQAAQILSDRDTALKETAGNLTAVWAESNTRESIYAALRLRETFATSGTRMRLRFFGGWNFGARPFEKRNWTVDAYALGVPMGADLPARSAQAAAPAFIVWAAKDPNSANLDRAQIVKVWIEGGRQHEKIFDVVPSGDRTQLAAAWTDPEFDSRHAAAYYLRVLEIPTPRWSTLLAIKNGLPPPEGAPLTIQQRAWSSPIWYTP